MIDISVENIPIHSVLAGSQGWQTGYVVTGNAAHLASALQRFLRRRGYYALLVHTREDLVFRHTALRSSAWQALQTIVTIKHVREEA